MLPDKLDRNGHPRRWLGPIAAAEAEAFAAAGKDVLVFRGQRAGPLERLPGPQEGQRAEMNAVRADPAPVRRQRAGRGAVTALADMIDRETRALLEHLAGTDEQELDRLAQLATLMQQVPDQLGPPTPRPLHSMARDHAAERTATS